MDFDTDEMLSLHDEDKAEEPIVDSVETSSVSTITPENSLDDGTVQRVPTWRSVLDFLLAFIVAAGIFFLLRVFVAEPFRIPSGSMLQTIQLEDHVLAEKISVAIDHMPEPGQIITFVNPRDTSETLIKRCIAIEGQTIDLIDGVVYIDGQPLDEPYTNGEATRPMKCDGKVQTSNIEYPFTIPDGCFWAMGDNRGNSSDSRVFGPVRAETVTGHAIFTYWPLVRTNSDGELYLNVGILK